MNRSTEEGISLVAAAGGVYNTWQATQTPHNKVSRLLAFYQPYRITMCQAEHKLHPQVKEEKKTQ